MLTQDDLQAIKELIDTAIKPLRDDIKELKKDMVEVKLHIGKLYARTSNALNFQSVESYGIENEITEAVLPHLQQRFAAYDVETFDLKELTFVDSNQVLTELDGAFMLKSKQIPGVEHSKTKYLVIVEAKHSVTFDNVNYKLEQMYKLMKYTASAKNFMQGVEGVYSRKFQRHVRDFKLHEIDSVHLYIGGPVWEKGTVTYMQRLIGTPIKDGKGNQVPPLDALLQYSRPSMSPQEQNDVIQYMKNKIGMIVPKGMRYNIVDVDSFSGGGKRKRVSKGPIMQILANYTRHVFT